MFLQDVVGVIATIGGNRVQDLFAGRQPPLRTNIDGAGVCPVDIVLTVKRQRFDVGENGEGFERSGPPPWPR
jgi:hypothetical protein